MHHIQLNILRNLIRNEKLRYKDLKPRTLDPNLFIYHLKHLQQQGLVNKTEDGFYTLSSKGLLEADNRQLDDEKIPLYFQPRLVLLLAVEDKEKGWLLHTRTVQPLLGQTGFLHGNVEMGLPIAEAAAERLKNMAGLRASFKYIGNATITIYKANREVESYVHAVILYAKNPKGTLLPRILIGTNKWVKQIDFKSKDLIPSMETLVKKIETGKQFFIELEYIYDNRTKKYKLR